MLVILEQHEGFPNPNLSIEHTQYYTIEKSRSQQILNENEECFRKEHENCTMYVKIR